MITYFSKICYIFCMIDLHTHSTASDCEISPSELIKYAAEKGITHLALTDHDTTDGLDEAEKAAAEEGIHFIRGIEINIERNRGEFHLLGLNLQKNSPELDQIIIQLQEAREVRNRQIIEKMKNDGLDVSYEELKELFKVKTIGRPHFAAYLVQKKLVRHRQQAFDRYIGQSRPYYVERKGADLSESVDAIIKSGGIPVLAHPMSLYVSWGKLEAVLGEIKDAGVKGLEAWHPGVRKNEAIRLEEAARKLGFFVTAGSDFHGENIRADRKIGHTAGMMKIDDRFWTEELLPAINS